MDTVLKKPHSFLMKSAAFIWNDIYYIEIIFVAQYFALKKDVLKKVFSIEVLKSLS